MNLMDRQPYETDRFGKRCENTDITSLEPGEILDDVVTALATNPSSICDGAEFLCDKVGNDVAYLSSATPKDLNYTYDSRLIMPYAYAKVAGQRYELQRLHSLSGATCRSLGIGHGARLSHHAIRDDGSAKQSWDAVVVWRNGEFVARQKNTDSFKRRGGQVFHYQQTTTLNCDVQARLHLGIAFSQQLYWGVLLGLKGRRVRVSSDPAGIREFFKTREVGPNGRRAALRHWVRAHARRRKLAADEAAEERTWVRRHLRGALTFEWNGLPCEIVVSESDRIELENYGK